jgi:DNA-binding NarL/FixJ family response regulator
MNQVAHQTERVTVSDPGNNKGSFHLLIVDDDSTIRDNLREYLANFHQAEYQLAIDEASTAEDALEKLESNNYDLVISDINLPDKDGFYILGQAVKKHPSIKKALITAYDLDTYIQMAKDEKIYNIIIKTAPFNFIELSNVVDNLLNPESAFGLEKYVDGGDEAFKQIILSSSEDIMPAQQELKEFFMAYNLPDLDALAIVVVEAITNAVYHSAKNEDGSLRYKKGEVINQLAPEEQVIVTYGADHEKVGVAIRDQGGTVSADEVLYWLERNISGNSLMDSHGRGLYLIHRLMDRVIINLARQKSTEIILLHYTSAEASDNKPLYINEIT